MQSRGTDWRDYSAPVLLIGSIVFALLSIGLNIAFPTNTTVYNVWLTVVLIIAGIVALVLIRNRALAVQLFLWSMLVIIGGMVALDARQSGNLPAILYIPPIAAVAMCALVSFRAAFAYCGGVASILIPSGVAYDALGWAVMLVASATFYIAVDWIKARRRGELAQVSTVLWGFAGDLRELTDEYVE